jgi:ADP-ribosyl-[dinitrogen reductase] hydrolase
MNVYDNIFNGCLIGYVVGDALGGPLEFSERDSLNQFTEMETNYLYDLPAGYWTEKTSQMLCMALSLTERNVFTYEDFLLKYHKFVTDGYLTPNEKPFDVTDFMRITCIKIGQDLKYRRKLQPIINPYDYHQVDCEPLLRIAPIVLKYYKQPTICMNHVENATKLTHISVTCIDVCKFYASLMIGALMGVKKKTLLSSSFNIMDITTYNELRYNIFSQEYLCHCSDTIVTFSEQQVKCKSTLENTFIRYLFPAVIKIQKGSYKQKKRDQLISNNNILNTIECALWAFYSTDTFEKGCIQAINLGNNSAAIGAIYGQLAGLYYGFSEIPQKWSSKVHKLSLFEELNVKLK